MTDTIRTWTRHELEEAVKNDPNERTMLRLAISPKVLLLLMQWASDHGDPCELVSVYGDPDRAELKFFRAG